jgi:hypothetical protein
VCGVCRVGEEAWGGDREIGDSMSGSYTEEELRSDLEELFLLGADYERACERQSYSADNIGIEASFLKDSIVSRIMSKDETEE